MNHRNCKYLTGCCLTAVTLGPGAFRAQKLVPVNQRVADQECSCFVSFRYSYGTLNECCRIGRLATHARNFFRKLIGA